MAKNKQEKPQDAKGRKHREQAARRSRERTAAGAEIGKLPRVKNPRRKKACRTDLLRFLVEYFPHSTGLSPFGDDQIAMIRSCQHTILNGGRAIHRLPRGYVKTTISEGAAIWAGLYGHRKFIPIFSATKAEADGIIGSVKMELTENDLLLGDFPEVCFPLCALENRANRCASQTYRKKPTYCEWSADTIVLPTIPRSPATGVILTARGITAAARGMRHTCVDGSKRRPDFAIIDDFQTDESARSKLQTDSLLGIIKKAIGRCGGHSRAVAMIVNATPICPGDGVDQLSDPGKNPAWRVMRSKMMPAFSDAHKTLWLVDYAKIRNSFDRHDPDSQEAARRAATQFYVDHRAEMDAGCKVSWVHCYSTDDGEISAIQHAYNILIDEGVDVFNSECQDQPMVEKIASRRLTDAIVSAKINGMARLTVPKAAEHVTAYVDVHMRLLYYVVAAWCRDFTGAVIDYGTYPEQPLPYFAQDSAPVSMADVAPGTTEDAWIVAGLQVLTSRLLATTYMREDAAEMRIGRLLIDARWGEKNALVKQFCRRHPQSGTLLMAAQGLGIGPAQKDFDEYRPEVGARAGFGWRIGPPVNGDRWVSIDVNTMKTFVASRLILPLATPGGLELFGSDARQHPLFADHCCSEAPIDMTAKRDIGKLRTKQVWEWLMPHNDNHWWDCLVGSAVGASMLGATIPGMERSRGRKDPMSRPSASDLARGK